MKRRERIENKRISILNGQILQDIDENSNKYQRVLKAERIIKCNETFTYTKQYEISSRTSTQPGDIP